MNEKVTTPMLPPNFHNARPHSPAQPSKTDGRACFVGSTLVDTTLGRCRIAELAALSVRRDTATGLHFDYLARLDDVHTQSIATFEVLASEQLDELEGGARDELAALLVQERTQLASQYAQLRGDAIEKAVQRIARMMPKALVYDPSTGDIVERVIVKVWSPKTASALVDVTIDAGPLKVRCTPEHVFITPEGDFAAEVLLGVDIWRVSPGLSVEAYSVPAVEAVQLDSPVAVYDMQVDGIASYSVSPLSGCCSAVVHNSTFEGLEFARVFSTTETTYTKGKYQDPATGDEFEFEAPIGWSAQAVTVMATKYARKTGVPEGAKPWELELTPARTEVRRGLHAELGAETSARQIFGRLAGAWAYWGLKLGYFDQANAQVFREELTAMLEQQVAAPNSPQWFNTGLHWAYGIEGKAQGHYAAKVHATDTCAAVVNHEYVLPCNDSYTRPQVHACFIQGVEDDLVGENGIMDLMVREARLFKFGSGTGTNYSPIRGKGEPLAGGGSSSGLMSFLTVSDRSAGAIKSGGTTRRAARMVVLDADHPDIEEFIAWKPREEEKVRALRDAGIGEVGSFEDEATNTVSGQNGNNSVRVTDKFMRAVEDNDTWELTYRTTGAASKTLLARDLWSQICTAAWQCADPGLQFHDTCNAWHTCGADGEITSTNPCAEYSFLHDTACNLASLNLVKFVSVADHTFDLESYKHAVRLWTIVLDISVSMAGYPSKQIAERSMEYRTLGLGYANLGAALMRQGIPYDSDEGRAWCSRASSRLGSYSWQTSAELAKLLGPFPAYERNKEYVHKVLTQHLNASVEHGGNGAWIAALPAVHEHGARNAQCTLLAPTGTISIIMDCDSTGIEPVYALKSTKQLAGGGHFELTCGAAAKYLQATYYEYVEGDTPYDESDPVLACAHDISVHGHLGMMAAAQPFLCGAISKTVNMPHTATVEDVSDAYKWAWSNGIKCVALYRKGSKANEVLTTEDASLEDYVDAVANNAAAEADRLRMRPGDSRTDEEGYAVDSKYTGRPSTHVVDTFVQHLEFTWDNQALAGVAPALARGEREEPPAHRSGDTVKLKIGGDSHYVQLSRFDDGRICEVFLTVGKQGGAVQGLANALAIALSIGLQHGVPLDAYSSALRYQRFEPMGLVPGAPLGIRTATSPVDALAQVLSALQDGPAVPAPAQVEPVSEPLSAPERVSKTQTGEICSNCRSTNMQQAGSCSTCLECGTTTGCG